MSVSCEVGAYLLFELDFGEPAMQIRALSMDLLHFLYEICVLILCAIECENALSFAHYLHQERSD
jgi:hypothetical protein